MAFIRIRNLAYDEDGSIIRGTATIIDVKYVSNAQYHAYPTVRENLGRPVFISEDKKSGIFNSPTRGLIEYDSESDTFADVKRDDPRLPESMKTPFQPEIHTVFGDAYLLLEFLDFSGLNSVLKSIFTKKTDYERLLCHVLHGVLKDGSRVTCDNFITGSFASYLVPELQTLSSLKSDTYFYTVMGQDRSRVTFFQNFAKLMRKKEPKFGTACYVDSTPLPNDIEDNPFRALCSHGVSGTTDMMRLAVVLDNATGMPVWYDIIAGNIVDLSTTKKIIQDVDDSLGIKVNSLVVDAGYVSKELIQEYNIGTEGIFIGRMPARKGYPFKELYHEVKSKISNGKYMFRREGHTYSGFKEKIELFDVEEYAYIYIDRFTADARFNEYLKEHEEEFEKLKMSEQTWISVKFGFFVLLSNIDSTPKDILTRYFERTQVETVFKTSKEYLNILPLSKWTDTTVRGKILHDIIDTIVLLQFRKRRENPKISITEILGKTRCLICFLNNKGTVTIDTPNKQVRAYYKMLGVKVPGTLKVEEYRKKLVGDDWKEI